MPPLSKGRITRSNNFKDVLRLYALGHILGEGREDLKEIKLCQSYKKN